MVFSGVFFSEGSEGEKKGMGAWKIHNVREGRRGGVILDGLVMICAGSTCRKSFCVSVSLHLFSLLPFFSGANIKKYVCTSIYFSFLFAVPLCYFGWCSFFSMPSHPSGCDVSATNKRYVRFAFEARRLDVEERRGVK